MASITTNHAQKRSSKLFRSSFFVCAILFGVLGLSTFALAKPRINAPRVRDEPRWNSQIFMRGPQQAANKSIPILERDYRPGHVYGNMQRRHHYRGTVIPSHRDRTDMLDAFRGHPVNRYR